MFFIFSIVLLLSFYLIAKVVDDYFIKSLDKIAEDLKMSSDAAGATLMAVGSSAPEIFIAIFAVFRPGDHAAIGIGNIVGSAIFNILAIIGIAAIVKKAVVAWQAVLRDLVFYAISVLLIILLFSNGKIELIDSIILILIYIIYVILVIFWQKIFKYKDPNEQIEIKIQKEKKENVFTKITYPLDAIMKLFFPNEKRYYLIFLTSIIIIAALSWVLVESAIAIAHILNISETIIAVTVLAAGTSIPDLLSSIVVAKQGRSGMAISNSIGSNIFDILIGLGLPFLLITLIKGGTVNLDISNLNTSVWFLLSSIIILFVLFILNKWIVGRKMGIFLLLLYASYIIWAIQNVV